MNEQETNLLPALTIEVSGLVKQSNLGIYRDKAIEIIESIPTNPQTDDELAQGEIDSKWCKQIEDQMKAVKDAAIAQTVDIETLFKMIDEISDTAREKRLTLEKNIKASKDSLRDAIARDAELELQKYLQTLNSDLPKTCYIALPPFIFRDAMKGRRTLEGCKEAVRKVLDEEIKKACDIYAVIVTNWKAMEGKDHLMRDFPAQCRKTPEDFAELLAMREREEELRLESEKLKQEAEIAKKHQQIAEQIEANRERDRAAAQTVIEEAAAESVTLNARTDDSVQMPEPTPITTITLPVASDSAKESANLINAFMRTEDFGDERWKIKSILVKFEKFRANQLAQEAA